VFKGFHFVKDDGRNIRVSSQAPLVDAPGAARQADQLPCDRSRLHLKLPRRLALGHPNAKQAKDFLIDLGLALSEGGGRGLRRKIQAASSAGIALNQRGSAECLSEKTSLNHATFTGRALWTHGDTS